MILRIFISFFSFFFFFNDTATTEIYTLSLHDALPISFSAQRVESVQDYRPSALDARLVRGIRQAKLVGQDEQRSEEHTSELQSRLHLVCRLLLEKKKKSM